MTWHDMTWHTCTNLGHAEREREREIYIRISTILGECWYEYGSKRNKWVTYKRVWSRPIEKGIRYTLKITKVARNKYILSSLGMDQGYGAYHSVSLRDVWITSMDRGYASSVSLGYGLGPYLPHTHIYLFISIYLCYSSLMLDEIHWDPPRSEMWFPSPQNHAVEGTAGSNFLGSTAICEWILCIITHIYNHIYKYIW